MGKEEEITMERRRYPRIESLCLVSYTSKAEKVQKTAVSMARTINISTGGAGIEVYQPISCNSIMEMEISVMEDIFSVQGKVVHSRKLSNGNFMIGVSFDQLQEKLSSSVRDYP
ncbi:MAG: hypothetical protein B1H11_11170 [Desulfobacteraceae bacterium 4484_190.1]|nr:MAG: hypothetical protein B1H11_11170 [Desulfobacteraceae bacterium 4484_190.1]